MKEFIPYLPLFIAIIAALIAYITTQRNNKINRFYQQVDVNLTEILGPIHLRIDSIMTVKNAKKREEYLDDLFCYSPILKVNLYKLGDRFIIEYLIRTKNLYKNFKETRQIKDWEVFWNNFYSLHIMVNNYYWDNFHSLYGEYRWFQRTLNSNVFIRLWHELLYLLYQATQFSMLVSILFVVYSLYDHFTVKYLPLNTIYYAMILFFIILMVFAFLMILGADIHGLRQKKSSLVRQLGEKYAPNVIYYWDNKFLVKKRKIFTPEMYKKSISTDEDKDYIK